MDPVSCKSTYNSIIVYNSRSIVCHGSCILQKQLYSVQYYVSHQFPDCFQVREEISMLHKLCNETEWFLDGDTANECDHMRIVALGDLLHRINFIEKISSLTSRGTGCSEGEGGREREREGGRGRETGVHQEPPNKNNLLSLRCQTMKFSVQLYYLSLCH